MRKRIPFLAILIPVICLLAVVLYNLPPIHDRLAWRLDALKADLKYALNPPEQQIFVPQTGEPPAPVITATATIFIPTPSPTLSPEAVEALLNPTATPTATLSPTPLPPQVLLSGIRHEYQRWNNCGPANLSMALSFWGWQGTQSDTAPFLKPNDRDKNVMPYEMEDYIESQTDLYASVRIGGDVQMLKALIAAGYPVIIEKGFESIQFEGWMGHYQVVNGFDDTKGVYYVQDSYKGPDIPYRYEDLESEWRAFNYTYLVIYPPDHRERVLSILGLQAYDNFNNHHAAQKAEAEVQALSGRDLYFSWFNRGSSLVALQDYANAALAYDTAFANYQNIPEKERPWRMLWYQTGPYFAYYYTGRYQDVIELSTLTLEAMSEPILEESYYWRALAFLATGQNESAVDDLRVCLEVHPEFEPCVSQLRLLGLEP